MKTLVLLLTLVLCAAGSARAQAPNLTLPEASPKASVTQTVGLTEITITYHRPAVAGRKIWGDLVPYGEVWRAGANENTTISLSSPVSIAGKPLAAGTYGLHMIPAAPGKAWSVIFSTCSVAWGSYSYDPKEDALRVAVTPRPGEPTERLSFTFEDPTDKTVSAVLRWERLKVAIPIQVNTPAVVMAHMRGELRGQPRFVSQAWSRAAHYWLDNGGDLGEALHLSDESLKLGESFQNLEVRSRILEKQGDAKQAAELRAKALKLATENDLNLYGYGLLQSKKVDEAIEIFKKNAQDHPGSWNAYDSLGEAQLAKGDQKAAAASYGKALALVKDDANKQRIQRVLAKLGSK